MTVKDRIVLYLQQNPNGADDDKVASDLHLSSRQQANASCRDLEKEGLIERRKVHGKIHNFWIGPLISSAWGIDAVSLTERSWDWEGNVQAKVVARLVSDGFDILSVSNTERRERGKDIMAAKSAEQFWVTVKGFPAGTERTHPSTQAGHWFKQAVFDVIDYREESKSVGLAIGLPEHKRYRRLAAKVNWLQEAARFSYYWVQQDGSVFVE